MDYSSEISIIKKLIRKTELKQNDFVLLLVNTSYEKNINLTSNSVLEQLSVSDLSSANLLEIETSFRLSSKYYRFYHSSAEFLGSLLLGELDSNKKLLLYSTTHLDSSATGRSIIPLIATKKNIISLTSSPYSLAITKNKFDYFKLLDGIVPIPRTIFLEEDIMSIDSYPVIVKPTLECCAKNVNLIHDKDSLIKQYKIINSELKQPVIVQEYVEGLEINVPILRYDNNKYLPLPPTIIVPNSNSQILTEDIIKNGEYHYILPNSEEYPLNYETIRQLQDYSQKIATRLDLGGLSRIDFKLNKRDNIPYVFDIASIPYLTKYDACYQSVHSLFPDDSEALYKMIIGSAL